MKIYEKLKIKKMSHPIEYSIFKMYKRKKERKKERKIKDEKLSHLAVSWNSRKRQAQTQPVVERLRPT